MNKIEELEKMLKAAALEADELRLEIKDLKERNENQVRVIMYYKELCGERIPEALQFHDIKKSDGYTFEDKFFNDISGFEVRYGKHGWDNGEKVE